MSRGPKSNSSSCIESVVALFNAIAKTKKDAADLENAEKSKDKEGQSIKH